MKKLLKKLLRENSTPVSIVDEYFIQEGPEFNCDCCKYFDIESLNSKGGFEHPAYYMIEKMQRYTLKFIKPKQYIYAIARGFGNLSYDDATAHVNWGNVDKYAEAMQSGSKFPIGYYLEGKADQEGRHRALAAAKIGCEAIPVVVIQDLDRDDIDDLATSMKGLTYEEIEVKFKEMGYDGISGLDYRTIKNYIEHRL
jgi:hypothetical protein|tara:strand:- start:793 stop:1383 length:591 start_codon:yes stop_codon:yes gene_type:complete